MEVGLNNKRGHIRIMYRKYSATHVDTIETSSIHRKKRENTKRNKFSEKVLISQTKLQTKFQNSEFPGKN